MKTILVLTDFSSAAEHATRYAAVLAKTVNASVTLLHAYQLPLPVTEMPVLAVSPVELKRITDEGLQKAREEAQASAPGTAFFAEGRLGDAVEEAMDFCRLHEVFAVVTGLKVAGNFERVLFGSTTLSLLKKCTHPVLSVPEGAALAAPQNLALAVDFLKPEETPAAKIAALVKDLSAALQVVHVETEGEKPADPSALLAALHAEPSAYHSLRGDDVTEGIKQYAKQNNIDLVMVLPHRHTLWERLFFKGHTAGLVQALGVPVLSLHAGK